MEQQPSKDEHKDWAELRLDREKTANSICQNLVAAGVLLPAEVERYKGVLRKYDALKLVKVLLESWLLRETHEEVQH
ncbi:hypothetical protein ES704_02765 [subsurface metagenome]|jgi:hypothetical protein